MLTLLHGSFEPMLYGVIIFLGLLSILLKFKYQMWFALTVEIAVFVLVFKLHGGTMNGGFAATVAALLAGVIIPILFRRSA